MLMKKLILQINENKFVINLRQNKTAELIKKALPINSQVQKWGDEIFFNTNITIPLENHARDVVKLGEIAYWTEGSAIAIGYGKTPVSRGDEIRLIGPCNIWADATFKRSDFKNINAGDQINLKWE